MKFTKEQVKDLVCNNEVDTEYGENRRWSRSNTSVVEADDGKFYKLQWEEGLTESQPNEFRNQEVEEVELVEEEKTVIVKTWRVI